VAALLEQPRLHTVSELEVVQNLELTAGEARQLHRLQDEFLRSCLSLGFASLRACLGMTREPPATAHFSTIVDHLVTIADATRAAIGAVPLPLTPAGEAALSERLREAALDLLRCYEEIHAPARRDVPERAPTDRERLFLEFVTGLCMAWISAEVRRVVATELLCSMPCAGAEPGGGHGGEDLLRALWSVRPSTSRAEGRDPEIAAMARLVDIVYLDSLLSVSSDAIDECYARSGAHTEIIGRVCGALERKPQLRDAMRAICSMRHIPGGERGSGDPSAGDGAPAAIISMAQTLHWSGIGVDGSGLWVEHEPLAQLAHHSLAYSNNFSKAAEVLGDLFADTRAQASAVTAQFLSAMAPREHGPAQRAYRVFEDASGPNAQFVSEIARRLEDLCGGRGRVAVHVSAADASGANICSLLDHAARRSTPSGGEACRIEAVRYRDLLLPLLNGFTAEHADGLTDRYDAYLVSLALHHVTDGVRGLGFLLEALRFGTRVVRPSGCLAFLEVAELGSAMELLMPLDLVDRVGSMPLDIHEALPFSALAVATTGDPAGRRGSVKLPWQRRELGRRFTSDEHATMAFLLLEVLEVPEDLPAQLDELRAREGIAACDRLLQARLSMHAHGESSGALPMDHRSSPCEVSPAPPVRFTTSAPVWR
jgi:hypothetical protein